MTDPKKKSLPVYASADIHDQQILIWDKGVIKGLSYNVKQFFGNLVANFHLRLHALNSTLDHSSTITPGDIIDADGNGLPHDSGITTASVNNIINASSGIKFQIESGEVVKVDNDYQYLLRDHLYLNGGTIQLNGNAEMIIF